MTAFVRTTLDTRADVVATYKAQGTDDRGIKVFETQLMQEHPIRRLRKELQPPAERALLKETAYGIADVWRALDAERDATLRRTDGQIAEERRANVGAHLKTADAINVARLRESEDVGEVRQILSAAQQAGKSVFDEAVAIIRPRVQRLAAAETGLRRSLGSSPSQVTSGWFSLLCELSAPSAPSDRQRLDAVTEHYDEQKRRLLACAAAVHPDLPRLIQQAVLRAAGRG
jgi:hypothetical protein